MTGFRKWLVILAAWWGVVNLISLPEHLRAIREGATAVVVLAQVFVGFVLGPVTADEYAILGSVFFIIWPAYAVLLHKMLSGRWGFRDGIIPSLVAAAVMVLATIVTRVGAAIVYYGIPTPGMLISALPGYLDLTFRMVVIATFANLLSWPVASLKRRGSVGLSSSLNRNTPPV